MHDCNYLPDAVFSTKLWPKAANIQFGREKVNSRSDFENVSMLTCKISILNCLTKVDLG